MDLNKYNEERYCEYLSDVDIAQEEIKKMLLWPKEEIICDFYAIPSHNYQTFYMAVYKDKDDWEMVYAKPQIYTYRYLEPIRMHSFVDVKETDNHSSEEGRFIMGIKKIPGELKNIIVDVINCLPEKHLGDENILTIDGVFQAVRVFEGSEVVKEVFYNFSSSIPLKSESTQMRDILDDLYLTLGDFITQSEEYYVRNCQPVYKE